MGEERYQLVIYEKDYDKKSDKYARRHGTKLVSDEYQALFRADTAPAVDYVWDDDYPREVGRLYIFDTDPASRTQDADIIKSEGDLAFEAHMEGHWKPKTRGQALFSKVMVMLSCVLGIFIAFLAYQEYTRSADFSYYIRTQERELSQDVQQLQQPPQEQQADAGEPTGEQVFQHAEGTQFVTADEPPTPTPTPTPLPDFS